METFFERYHNLFDFRKMSLIALKIVYYNEINYNKIWEALNVYFSNKLQFERKLYYYRPGLTTRETKMTVVRMRSFIFWLKQEKPLALRLCE